MAVHTTITVGECTAQFDGVLSKGTTTAVIVTMPTAGTYRVTCGADAWTAPGTHARVDTAAAPMTIRPASA